MKLCTGCKHLHMRPGAIPKCQEHWLPHAWVVDPFTGVGRYEARSKYQQGTVWWMTVEEMRKPGGPCGPEAKLFAPSLTWRLLERLERLFGRGESA